MLLRVTVGGGRLIVGSVASVRWIEVVKYLETEYKLADGSSLRGGEDCAAPEIQAVTGRQVERADEICWLPLSPHGQTTAQFGTGFGPTTFSVLKICALTAKLA